MAIPTMKRKRIRSSTEGARAQAIDPPTKSQRSILKIRRRPSLSASGPRNPAPKIDPTIAAAETSPTIVALRLYCSLISGLAIPMTKKS